MRAVYVARTHTLTTHHLQLLMRNNLCPLQLAVELHGTIYDSPEKRNMIKNKTKPCFHIEKRPKLIIFIVKNQIYTSFEIHYTIIHSLKNSLNWTNIFISLNVRQPPICWCYRDEEICSPPTARFCSIGRTTGTT